MRRLPKASPLHILVSRRRLLVALIVTAVLMMTIVTGRFSPQAEAIRQPPPVKNETRAVDVSRVSAGVGGCTTPQFAEATGSPVGAGNSPTSVAVGDFNGDGKQDLAVVNFGDDNVTIRLGDGMGGFPDANATTAGADDSPIFVAIGDFNRDGKQDLAVTNRDSNNVTIRLGDGMGGFTQATGSPVDAGLGLE